MSANLSSRVKFTKVKDHTAAATTAVNSAAINMAGYEGVVFITSVGTAATTVIANIAQATASGGSFADLAGSGVNTGTSSNEDVLIEIHRPGEKWLRLEVARGGSTTVESIWALQYGARTNPTNTVAGTLGAELHASPAEGTK